MLVSKRTLLFQGPVFRFSIKVDERKHNLGHVYRDIHNCVCVVFVLWVLLILSMFVFHIDCRYM